jgi:hypothetical protein
MVPHVARGLFAAFWGHHSPERPEHGNAFLSCRPTASATRRKKAVENARTCRFRLLMSDYFFLEALFEAFTFRDVVFLLGSHACVAILTRDSTTVTPSVSSNLRCREE